MFAHFHTEHFRVLAFAQLTRESLGEEVEPIKNAVYLNILNEEIDFIGKFENLESDWRSTISTSSSDCTKLARSLSPAPSWHLLDKALSITKLAFLQKTGKTLHQPVWSFNST